MPTTYDSYAAMPQSLTLEEMRSVHDAILTEVGSDPDALELYQDLIESSVRYAKFRMDWRFLNVEEKMDIDSDRSSAHTSCITKLNILARCMRTQQKPATWRDTLGDAEADPYIRKRLGDFACYLAFVTALNAR